MTDEMGKKPDRSRDSVRVPHLRGRSLEPADLGQHGVTFEVPADLTHEYRYMQGQHITLRAIVDGTIAP